MGSRCFRRNVDDRSGDQDDNRPFRDLARTHSGPTEAGLDQPRASHDQLFSRGNHLSSSLSKHSRSRIKRFMSGDDHFRPLVMVICGRDIANFRSNDNNFRERKERFLQETSSSSLESPGRTNCGLESTGSGI